jgi:hypothetical protein
MSAKYGWGLTGWHEACWETNLEQKCSCDCHAAQPKKEEKND